MATLRNTAHSNNIETAVAATFADDDTLIIDRSADSFNTNLSHEDINFTKVQFGAGWSGNIEETPFKFECVGSGRSIICESRSRRLKLGGGGSGVTDWTRLIVNMQGEVEVTDVQIIAGEVINGSLMVRDSVDLDSLRVDGGRAHVMESAANPTVDTLAINGGVCVLDRDVTDIDVRGGELIIDHESVIPATLDIDGGVVRVGLHGGTITAMVMRAGVLDLSKVSGPLTISSATVGSKGVCRIIMPADDTLITWTSFTKSGVGDPRQT